MKDAQAETVPGTGKGVLLLVICGITAGILCGTALGYGYLRLRAPARAGSEFESLEDLRRAMLVRDPSDNIPGESVNLRVIVEPHPADDIIYTLRKNMDIEFQQVRVQTNSHGMRSPERPLDKPPGVYRIALLGDSFAFGWGVEQRKTFAQRMEDRLNAHTGGSPRVEVLNFGVPGYSTFQEVGHFLEYGQHFSPDAVLIYFVENDFGMPFFIKDFESDKLEPATAIKILKQEVKGNAAGEYKLGKLYGRADASKALLKLSDFLRAKNIPLLLTFNPRRGWEEDQKRLWALPQRPEIKLLSLRDGFMKIVEQNKYTVKELKLDGDPHPSQLMHGMLGDLLAEHYIASGVLPSASQ